MANLVLTDEQVTHFDKQGYLILPSHSHNLVNPAALKQWTHEIQNLPRSPGKWMPYDELTSTGDRQLMRTENFVDYHPNFSSLLHGAALTSLLTQLTRTNMLLFKDKINYKLPNGNGFNAHLDAPAYDHIGPAGMPHITANFAVDAATIANGCIEVVAGSHSISVPLSHGGAIDKAWEQAQTWIPVELQPGDLLVFGSRLAHRSRKNATPEARTSVYATYYPASAGEELRGQYYSDRRERFPPDHERIPGKDYSAGVARYAFAAPFTKIEETERVKA